MIQLMRISGNYKDTVLPQHVLTEISSPSLLLMHADYNGAKIKVIRTNCSSLLGKSGILALETKETFKVLQENDELISEYI